MAFWRRRSSGERELARCRSSSMRTGLLIALLSTGTATGCLPPVRPVVLAGRLLLPGGPVTGELLVDETGVIACAAESCASAPGYEKATHLAIENAVISPGLINGHDHTNSNTVGPQDHGLLRYQHRHDWRTGAEGATPLPLIKSTSDQAVIAAAELRLLLGGATSVVSTGGVRGLLRNLGSDDQAALEGLHGMADFFDTFPLGDGAGEMLTSGCAYPKVVTPQKAFARGAYTPHIAEGINRAAQNEPGCLQEVITARTTVAHGVGVNALDVDAIGRAGAKLSWSPRSNLSLYGDTAPITLYRNAGVPIALGTDWLPSGSMNLLRELACADAFNKAHLHSAISDAELWQMVTGNGAAAAGFDDQLGALQAGKVADVTVFDGAVRTDHRAVIEAGVEDVRLVLRGGRPLYGDADLVRALRGDGCAALDVCGRARELCNDAPASLEGALAAASSSYPLFFCRGAAPVGEPSCSPYRDTYPDGITATDRDGDGVPDSTDDCPDVFNPVRNMDGGAQADVDGDGFGDVCDARPLDPSMH